MLLESQVNYFMSETVLSVILESLMTLYLFTSRDVKIRVTLSAAHGVSPSRQCTVLCIIQGINQCSCFEDVFLCCSNYTGASFKDFNVNPGYTCTVTQQAVKMKQPLDKQQYCFTIDI